MNNKIANDLIRYAELVEDGALISPEEMNCASVMRLAAEALAQPEQEPVAWAMLHDSGDFIDAINPEEHARIEGDYKHALYTTPPQRTAAKGEDTRRAWVGLTEDEIEMIVENRRAAHWEFVRQVEALLKEKNNGS